MSMRIISSSCASSSSVTPKSQSKMPISTSVKDYTASYMTTVIIIEKFSAKFSDCNYSTYRGELQGLNYTFEIGQSGDYSCQVKIAGKVLLAVCIIFNLYIRCSTVTRHELLSVPCKVILQLFVADAPRAALSAIECTRGGMTAKREITPPRKKRSIKAALPSRDQRLCVMQDNGGKGKGSRRRRR